MTVYVCFDLLRSDMKQCSKSETKLRKVFQVCRIVCPKSTRNAELYLKMHQHVLNVVEAASGLTQVYNERFQMLVFAVDKQSPVTL